MAIVLRKARNIVTESFEGVDAKLSFIDVVSQPPGRDATYRGRP
jgi:hypothetical protein